MIHTENLTKSFGDQVAVDRLNLDIAEGEVFGFLGPNGAGKTTTIRMLTCLIAPTSGRARVLNYEVGRDDEQIRRNVGILTETPGMYDRLSAYRNLSIFARLYEVEQVDYQVEKYLKLLGLWERRDDAVGEFSKGMRQKLAIGRALLHEPQVLFLDEPTAALDPEASRLVHDFVAELKGRGRTIFLCTHNLDEADRLCDRVAVFKTHLRVLDTPGRLRQQVYGRQVAFHLGGPAELFLSQVKSLPFVDQAEAKDAKLIVTLDDPESRNPDIVRALVGAGADIQFVGELRYSLEDVYLQLMKEDAPAAG
ncbi:MAG: ABC transporter ATP-binding protein [Anaerolineae bacterium]|uniref:ABC transporter ATP-binding protein n=1 Tax=Promineifilum sp. TaxID=2664178 RepID=UPI001DF694BE|nr:ABC transporter ATP-binding protein [Anaerolineales bacterium]MCB8934098.1 ABC transporter ATP-binding protein [Promineifilum sp.]MCO5179720.1 ABC transporter ATP-binding protein [Promineifilum sp.]MCW5845720.1 ABC transporter ATP-binding protein [Anaerolineae bacterium]